MRVARPSPSVPRNRTGACAIPPRAFTLVTPPDPHSQPDLARSLPPPDVDRLALSEQLGPKLALALLRGTPHGGAKKPRRALLGGGGGLGGGAPSVTGGGGGGSIGGSISGRSSGRISGRVAHFDDAVSESTWRPGSPGTASCAGSLGAGSAAGVSQASWGGASGGGTSSGYGQRRGRGRGPPSVRSAGAAAEGKKPNRHAAAEAGLERALEMLHESERSLAEAKASSVHASPRPARPGVARCGRRAASESWAAAEW